jgi:A/G-specific adenine glycosylase
LTLDANRSAANDSLIAWYGTHKRNLPWRRSTDPYPVLVSEVMLQQTQVERVIPRFDSFMSMWPTVESLAAATTDDLLGEWSGLGYNSRALRLREAARVVSANGWPGTVESLQVLPGIGPYTAAAVGSIAFGENAAAVDTNLKRVLSRWAGEPLGGSVLERYAGAVAGMPAGDWNQALMDLGATVCTPREPQCTDCPVSQWCADPAVYEPPPRQSAYEGSHRQLRGALLRAHLAGNDLREAGHDLDRSDIEIETALDSLISEGLVSFEHS